MERLFDGKVYEILPLSSGIIFSYLKNELEIGDYVEYKMISFENRRLSNVVKSTYLLAKFGMDSQEIRKICENYISVKALVLPGGKVFVLEPDGKVTLADADSSVLWSGVLSYRSNKPSDVALVKDALWATYPECNAIIKYNLATMKEELRIGGTKSPFNRPVDIFVKNESEIVISNEKSAQLLQLNLDDYSLIELESFNEPLKQYIEVSGHRFVILESGLYIL